MKLVDIAKGQIEFADRLRSAFEPSSTTMAEPIARAVLAWAPLVERAVELSNDEDAKDEVLDLLVLAAGIPEDLRP